MKKSPLNLLLCFYFLIITGSLYAQENNYITSKYDFIPGEKVIFFDDFSSESIGDFPAQWLTNGSGEIVTLEKYPGKWLHITKMGYYIPEAKEDFTENFTIEFDFVPLTTEASENMYSFTFYLLSGILSEPGGGGEPGDAGFQIYLDNLNIFWKNWSAQTGLRFDGMVSFPFIQNEKYHVALWIQKQRVRLYANENKVLDVPRAIPAGSIPNIFRFESDQVSIPMISNFRIAAGLPDMRNRLLKDGKIVSYGILFDVNSDKLKPESYSTLKVIADILKEDSSLKLKVVGHTDSDGDDASNLDLSKRRAASVKNELASKFGADATRLETDGKGETEPVTDNNSSVNKAKNRRVEFINTKEKTAAQSVTAPPKAATGTSDATSAGGTGSFKDPRDGKTYKTVKIGTQIWMAENLAFKADTNCLAYENDENKAKIYGYFYSWDNAMKVCPSGWHLPDSTEWQSLIDYAGGESQTFLKLREKGNTFWEYTSNNETNSTGFTALPAGMASFPNSMFDKKTTFRSIGLEARWWSSSMDKDPDYNLNAYAFRLSYYFKDEIIVITTKNQGFSVRCIKD